MVETQDFRSMGEALGDAAAVLRANANSAGLETRVPTCPGWTVTDMVAHTGMVHRWTASYLTRSGRRTDEEVLAEARAATDVLDWYDDSLVEILNAIAQAPADLAVKFFLPDAPAPRDAWLRRQVHETSIHAADAMAARLQRTPRAAELWMPPALAADGIDEVLTGFVVRAQDKPVLAPGQRVLFSATDVDRHWLVAGTPDAVTTTRVGASEVDAVASDATAITRGSARALYLAVWNRGSEPEAPDRFWAAWRERFQVAWA